MEVATKQEKDTGLQQVSQKQEDSESSWTINYRMETLNDAGSLGLLPLPPSAGQEAELVDWGQFAHPTLPRCEVNVLRSHRGGHREVLEDGGEEKEQFHAGDTFSKTIPLPCRERRGEAPRWVQGRCTFCMEASALSHLTSQTSVSTATYLHGAGP